MPQSPRQACIFQGNPWSFLEPSSVIFANPFFEFFVRATGTAKFKVQWIEDKGVKGQHLQIFNMMLLDIAPTLAMYENTTEAFARTYWHWFALIQPAPMPESLIDNNPARYVRDVMGGRFAGLAPFSPGAMAEYERCALIPGTSTSVCEDYRASAGIDLEYDRIDMASGNRLVQPLRVLWGEQGAVGRCFDVLSLWRDRAVHLSGESLPCGHYLAEEQPEMVAAEALKFFKST